ncbi:MAG TPA: hypothetical protein V6C95_23505 [Coleofasciculaceae cyanobacterium]
MKPSLKLWLKAFEFGQVALMVILGVALFKYLFIEFFQKKLDFDFLVGGSIIPLFWTFAKKLADFKEDFNSLKEEVNQEQSERLADKNLLLRLDAKVEVLLQQESTNSRVDKLFDELQFIKTSNNSASE